MGNGFLQSVREVFSSVFGRADFEHVLNDNWDVSDTIPEEQQEAIQKALRNGAQRRAAPGAGSITPRWLLLWRRVVWAQSHTR